MQRYIIPSLEQWKVLTHRGAASYSSLEPLAKEVFDNIAQYGDQALKTYTEKFDKVKLEGFSVDTTEIELAKNRVPEKLKLAIQKAKENIYLFHKAQITEEVKVEIQTGVNCWQKKLPIEKVGLYIPGGSAPLFSTILMLAIPAQVAECDRIVLCSPPNSKGQLSDVILYTSNLCGVDQILKVGGVQAIAGMTLGTDTIPKVDKIFGPGNQFVTVAKQLATQYQVAIDMPAGPSELMVVSDQTGNPDFIASDLLSQAEHGPDSQVILVTNDIKIALEENGFIIEKNQIKLDRPIKELGIHNISVKLHPEVQAIVSVIVSRTDAEAETLIKGEEINIEKDENLTEEDTINIEEVFEDGAIPENIGEQAEDSFEEIEDKNDTEEANNEVNSEANDSKKELEDSS